MQIVIDIPEAKYIATKKFAESGMELDTLYKAVANGYVVPDGWCLANPAITYLMPKEEVPVVRKVLGIANTIYTVLDTADYSASKIDQIVRRLKLWEETHE